MRACAWAPCSGSLEGKRPHAVYCSRGCKTKASDQRRVVDGRARERDAARYQREGEHRRAYARRYLEEHPEEMRLVRERRKGRIRETACRFTTADWRAVLRHYRHRCAYCGAGGTLQREHVIPLARGGRHAVGNIVPACPTCNYSKGKKTLMEWRLIKEKISA